MDLKILKETPPWGWPEGAGKMFLKILADDQADASDRILAAELDAAVPKKVGRRILEASVRAPQDWHEEAIRVAYSSDDEDGRLTAVFSMRWVRGFDFS